MLTSVWAARGGHAERRTQYSRRPDELRRLTVTGEPPPLVGHRVLGGAPPRPTGRLRVLDLTRDTLRGRRSALLDLADDDTRQALFAGADVVVGGYRPGAPDRFGLRPDTPAQRHPGLVVVTLSAWVLDHATGYLAAAATLLAVARQRRDGGTHHVRPAPAGTAVWLQDAPAEPDRPAPDPQPVDPTPHLVVIPAPDGVLTPATPPGTVEGRSLVRPRPAPAYGTAAARWT